MEDKVDFRKHETKLIFYKYRLRLDFWNSFFLLTQQLKKNTIYQLFLLPANDIMIPGIGFTRGNITEISEKRYLNFSLKFHK